MTKQITLAMALCSALAMGCGSSTTTPATSDLAVALDLSAAAADMTVPHDLAPAPADMGPVEVLVGSGGNTFTPQNVTIKVGMTVKWTWTTSGHNVVSGTAPTPDKKFCSPMNTQPCDATGAPTSTAGATYSFTFTTAGTYPYFCRPHSGMMTGNILVQ